MVRLSSPATHLPPVVAGLLSGMMWQGVYAKIRQKPSETKQNGCILNVHETRRGAQNGSADEWLLKTKTVYASIKEDSMSEFFYKFYEVQYKFNDPVFIYE